MSYKNLQLDENDGIATLTLNRPEKRNALTLEMMDELRAAWDEVDASSARALIMTGAGKSFCSGMDLSALQGLSPAIEAATEPFSKALADSRRIADLFLHLYNFPKPIIAAVNGHAVAGGCGLATLCDITLAVPEAKFGYPEVRVGFMPAFVAVFLVRQIGEKRARDLLLTGRLIEASEAKELGLINEIVKADALPGRAREIAAQFAEASPASIRSTKRLLGDFAHGEIERELELSIEASARIRSTADFHEGLSAFLEKRRPRWAN